MQLKDLIFFSGIISKFSCMINYTGEVLLLAQLSKDPESPDFGETVFFFFFLVLGTEPRTFYMLGRGSTTEPHSQLFFKFI
jgi:hypothetical protein